MGQEVGEKRVKRTKSNLTQFKTVGYNRFYETMAFEAKKEGNYWDIDVTKEVKFNSNWYIEKITDNSDNKANEMHEEVIRELVKEQGK